MNTRRGFEHLYHLGDVISAPASGDRFRIHSIEIGPPVIGSQGHSVLYGGYVLNPPDRGSKYRCCFEHELATITYGKDSLDEMEAQAD